MLNKNTLSFCLAMGIACATVPAQAHHGAAAHFDLSTKVNVTGVITRFAFTNPHAYVYFDVTDASGATAEWRCESSSATLLRRNGWSADTLVPGQTIEVTGTPARREDNVCYANQMIVNGLEYSSRAKPPTAEEVAEMVVIDTESEHLLVLESGQPNISGVWVNTIRGGALGAITSGGVPIEGGRPGGMKPKLTAAGQAASDTYDDRFDNPTIVCEPTNIILNWGHEWEVNEIRQTEDAVFISAGNMDMERTIHLNMTEHPDNIVPSVIGHSIGKWEGDTLVVDTIGLTGRLLDGGSAVVQSDQAHITEQIKYVAESRQLIRDWILEDPLHFEEPFGGQNIQEKSAHPHKEYGCVNLGGKNNIRPEDLQRTRLHWRQK